MCLSIKVNSPERVLSQGEHLGFEWITVHNNLGHRCGYIRIPLGHPWHGQEYEIECDVHGGITFAQADIPCDKGGPDNAWWIGFDCAHSGDAPDPTLPNAMKREIFFEHGMVRSQEYVENECKSLCEQAAMIVP
jgi:hypothetical protein